MMKRIAFFLVMIALVGATLAGSPEAGTAWASGICGDCPGNCQDTCYASWQYCLPGCQTKYENCLAWCNN
jgi:hypothetical protein